MLMTFGKTLQAKLAILLPFMWLNLVNDTKLPTYLVKGLSHHVVQKIFSFWMIFLFFVFIHTLLKVMGRHHVPLQHCSGQFKLLPRSNPRFSSVEVFKELPIDGVDPCIIIVDQLVNLVGVCPLLESWKYITSNGHMVWPYNFIKV